jgi:hypothetical protein
VRVRVPVASSVLIAACATVSVGSEADAPYSQAVTAWTARAQIYDPVEQKAAFAATLESHIFREQRAREEAQLLGWSPETLQAELTKQTQGPDGETSFILGAYTERPRDNNLADVQSFWRVALETAGGELLPVKIEGLGRPDPTLRKLYPYLDVFSRVYRLHFAKVSEGPVTLRIASGYGIADLKFERL